jgi:ribose/xylose/arabinose/galactoside ABC-type transport system permease subunit
MNTRKGAFKKIINNYGAVFAFFLAILVFSITTSTFFRLENFQNIFIQSTALGVCAFGLTLVLISGEIDFSYGGLIGLVGAVLAGMLKQGYAPLTVTIVCLLIGVSTGLLNALLVVAFDLSSFLASVAVMFLCMGAERVYNHGVTVWIANKSMLSLVQGHLGPIPTPILLLLCLFALCWFFQTQTRAGQHVRAIGENVAAAKETGVRTRLVKTSVFVLAGVLFAFAGCLETLRNGGAIMYSGKQLLLFVLAAAFLGTVTFKAGKTNFPGTLLGAFFLITLMNGFTLLGMKFYLVPMAQGLILIAAVAIASLRRGAIEQVKF